MYFKKYHDDRKGIFITKPSIPPIEEYIDYLQQIWDNGILTNMGPLHEEFREKISDKLNVEMCIPCCNGHMGLELSIEAMELKGEIITTPFTFASTTHAIVRNGCTPVFCDIREDDCCIDTEKLESLINDKTVAILPVHVYGFPCNVDEIGRIADKYGVKLIYDAAHAFGVKLGENSIARYGDASVFSFHATKSFNTIEGGCVTLHDQSFGLRLYHLINFGIMGEEQVEYAGANAKFNEFQAAMGLCNLKYFEENRLKRQKIYKTYEGELSNVYGIKMLKAYRNDVLQNYSYCPVFFDKEILGKSRDDLYDYLANKNIYTRKYFYPLTSDYKCYRESGFNGNTPVAIKMAQQVLTLPIYPELKFDDVLYICELIRGFFEK